MAERVRERAQLEGRITAGHELIRQSGRQCRLRKFRRRRGSETYRVVVVEHLPREQKLYVRQIVFITVHNGTDTRRDYLYILEL